MTELLSILISDIAPIFLIAAAGYLLERRVSGSARVLSTLVFNVLSPALIFYQLSTSSISGPIAWKMAAFCVLLTASMGGVAAAALSFLHLSLKQKTSFLLSVMFSNSGNYALPVILFAFGREALSYAAVYFVTSAVMVYTVGVTIAGRDGVGTRQALSRLARIPALYASVLALIVIAFRISLPPVILRPVSMLSDAAIPIMLLILGMQLQRATFPEHPQAMLSAVGLSLLVSPLLGLALTALLGLTGVARATAIVVSAMPAAVVNTVLALEFDLDPNFVTGIVFLSTLLSPLTLVLLIAYLG